MDAIDRLGLLHKALSGAEMPGHKYKSRKRVKGSWVYDYGDKKGKGAGKGAADAKPSGTQRSKLRSLFAEIKHWIDNDPELTEEITAGVIVNAREITVLSENGDRHIYRTQDFLRSKGTSTKSAAKELYDAAMGDGAFDMGGEDSYRHDDDWTGDSDDDDSNDPMVHTHVGGLTHSETQTAFDRRRKDPLHPTRRKAKAAKPKAKPKAKVWSDDAANLHYATRPSYSV